MQVRYHVTSAVPGADVSAAELEAIVNDALSAGCPAELGVDHACGDIVATFEPAPVNASAMTARQTAAIARGIKDAAPACRVEQLPRFVAAHLVRIKATDSGLLVRVVAYDGFGMVDVTSHVGQLAGFRLYMAAGVGGRVNLYLPGKGYHAAQHIADTYAHVTGVRLAERLSQY